MSSFFKKRRVFRRRSSTTRDSRTSPVDKTAAKSASLSGSSKTLAEKWLIEKLVIWSWRGSRVARFSDDFGHESTNVLDVFSVRKK